MPKEEQSSDRSHQGLSQGGGVELSLDELAKGLATGTLSRGKALRLMGAALVGGTLASVGIGEAAADPPGCKRNGKVCTKDKVCCSRNCEGGICAAACVSNGGTCTTGSDCCSGLVCKGSTCAASCIPPNAIPCSSEEDCPGGCHCQQEASGANYCEMLAGGTNIPCTTSCDCPTGQFCHPFGTGGLCTVAC